MPGYRHETWRWLPLALLICTACLVSRHAVATDPEDLAAALRSRHGELTGQLETNPFRREIHIESEEFANELQSDIHAVVEHPFEAVSTALNHPAHWCDILTLHLNVKFCAHTSRNDGTLLTVNLGRKYHQALENTMRIEFEYREVVTDPEYFAVELYARHGPLTTRDHRISLEATPLGDGRTFLHFSYHYAFGLPGRIAMRGYLLTIGRNKVGFSVTDTGPDGQPVYTRGKRGVVERTAMRYYLAIDAYLATMDRADGDPLEHRLRHWYDATERYARQLHEMEREEYLDMKRREHRRQEVLQGTGQGMTMSVSSMTENR